MTRGGLVGSLLCGRVVWTVPVGALRAPRYFTACVLTQVDPQNRQKGEARDSVGSPVGALQ